MKRIKRSPEFKRKIAIEALKENKTYPYLLNDVEIAYPNHVWSSDSHLHSWKHIKGYRNTWSSTALLRNSQLSV